MCLKEMYKLFDWSMYEIEQTQMLQTSIKESHLNAMHRDKHVDSSSAHKFLLSDGVVETLFPDPTYIIERHMPLSTMPRLDLYFTNSELVTLSLLSKACVEYLCKMIVNTVSFMLRKGIHESTFHPPNHKKEMQQKKNTTNNALNFSPY